MFKKLLVVFMIVGVILIVIGLILIGGNFNKFIDSFNSEKDYSLVEKEDDGEVKELLIKMRSGDVVFHPYDSLGYKLSFYESEYDIKKVTFENNILSIDNQIKTRFRFFNFTFNSDKINTLNVYIPNTFNGKASIETSSGDIEIKDFNFTTLKINVSSGTVILDKVEVSGDTSISTSSGDVELSSFISNSLVSKSSSGEIKLNKATINKTILKSSSGSIKISESNVGSVTIDTSSGNVDLMNIEINDADIDLSSGNAKLKIIGQESEFKTDAKTSSGSIYYQGKRIAGSIYDPDGNKSLKVRCSSGNIRIDFIINN